MNDTIRNPMIRNLMHVQELAIYHDALCRSLWDYMHIQMNEDAAYYAARSAVEAWREYSRAVFMFEPFKD